MILNNPLNEDVSVGYLGETYTIPALESLEVSEDLGTFWKNTHGFLIVESAPVKVARAPKATAKKEEIETVEEVTTTDTTEEVVENKEEVVVPVATAKKTK